MIIMTPRPYLILFRANRSTFTGNFYHYPNFAWDMNDELHAVSPRTISWGDGMWNRFLGFQRSMVTHQASFLGIETRKEIDTLQDLCFITMWHPVKMKDFKEFWKINLIDAIPSLRNQFQLDTDGAKSSKGFKVFVWKIFVFPRVNVAISKILVRHRSLCVSGFTLVPNSRDFCT